MRTRPGRRCGGAFFVACHAIFAIDGSAITGTVGHFVVAPRTGQGVPRCPSYATRTNLRDLLCNLRDLLCNSRDAVFKLNAGVAKLRAVRSKSRAVLFKKSNAVLFK
jgi:hypothetical protein